MREKKKRFYKIKKKKNTRTWTEKSKPDGLAKNKKTKKQKKKKTYVFHNIM